MTYDPDMFWRCGSNVRAMDGRCAECGAHVEPGMRSCWAVIPRPDPNVTFGRVLTGATRNRQEPTP